MHFVWAKNLDKFFEILIGLHNIWTEQIFWIFVKNVQPQSFRQLHLIASTTKETLNTLWKVFDESLNDDAVDGKVHTVEKVYSDGATLEILWELHL